MNKTKHILLTIALLLGTLTASAQRFEVDGINYYITSVEELTVAVTYYGNYNSAKYKGDIIIPSSVFYNNNDYKVTSVGEYAFFACNITSVRIPKGVISIDYRAFEDCTSITSITLPESVTSIGNSAFYGCSSLTSIALPESVTSIGSWAFYGCSGLTSITIPEGVTSIGEYTFYGCSGITSIRIPDTVTIIDKYAFCECSNLGIVTIGKNVSSINGSAFQKGNKIHTVINYSSLTITERSSSAGWVAYYAVKVLDVDELDNVDGFLFSTTDNVHYLKGYIGEDVGIVLPDNYKGETYSIENYAFYGCVSLTSITVPESVTDIGWYAFKGCSSLATITCKATTPPAVISGDSFAEVDKSISVYVPAESVSAYQEATGWKDFANILPLAKEYSLNVTSAGYATLYLDYAVEIPEDVETYIATSVENNRLKMTQVTGVLPANTGVIVKAEEGDYTFVESDEVPTNVEGNLLKGTTIDTYITAEKNYTYYVLAKKNDVVCMYRAKLTEGKFLNNANKVYFPYYQSGLKIDDDKVNTDEEQLSNRFHFDFGETTSIDDVVCITQSSDIIYDLHGRRVENPEKGIYIIGGKKVVVK